MKHLIAAALGSAFLVSTAYAADMPLKAPMAPAPVAQNSWYVVVGAPVLFGGVDSSLQDRNCVTSIFIPCGIRGSMNGDGGFGVFGGVGYRFTPWFRGELRIGGGWSDIEGHVNAGLPATINGDFRAVSGLVNVYLDLAGLVAPGTFGRFEPYIGAGAGLSHNTISNPTVAVGIPLVHTMVFPGGDTTEFAWAVTAGTAYRFSHNWLLDVAYRYRDFGKAVTDPGTAIGNVFGPLPTNGFESRARGHSVDLAVRYEF